MQGGGRSQTPPRSGAAGKGEIPAYRTQSHRRSRHVIGTDPDTGWLTMLPLDPALGLDEHSALDVVHGLLYLPDRTVPVVRNGEVWTRDLQRPVVGRMNLGCVPVVSIGGA